MPSMGRILSRCPAGTFDLFCIRVSLFDRRTVSSPRPIGRRRRARAGAVKDGARQRPTVGTCP